MPEARLATHVRQPCEFAGWWRGQKREPSRAACPRPANDCPEPGQCAESTRADRVTIPVGVNPSRRGALPRVGSIPPWVPDGFLLALPGVGSRNRFAGPKRDRIKLWFHPYRSGARRGYAGSAPGPPHNIYPPVPSREVFPTRYPPRPEPSAGPIPEEDHPALEWLPRPDRFSREWLPEVSFEVNGTLHDARVIPWGAARKVPRPAGGRRLFPA